MNYQSQLELNNVMDAPSDIDIIIDEIHLSLMRLEINEIKRINGHVIGRTSEDMYRIDGSNIMYFYQVFSYLCNLLN